MSSTARSATWSGAFEPGKLEGFDIHAFLAELEVPGDTKLLDADRPLLLALSFSPSGPPVGTAVVPVADAQAYAATLEDGKVWKQLGGYVGVSDLTEYEPLAEPSPIAVGLPETASAGRVDLGKIFDMYAPLIEMGLAQIESLAQMQSSSSDMDFEGVLDWYIDGIESFIDSADVLDFGVATRGNDLDFTFALRTFQDSPMAELAAEGDAGMAKLAGCVDTGDSIVFLGGMEMSTLWESMEGLMDAGLTMYPESVREQLSQMIDGWKELSPLFGNAIAGSGGFTADGMRFTYYVDSPDPAQFIVKYMELFEKMRDSSGMFVLEGPTTSKIGDIEVQHVSMQITEEGLAALMEESSDTSVDPAQLKEIMDVMYGKDGLHFALASSGSRLVLTLGGDEAYLGGAVRRLQAQSAPPSRTPEWDRPPGGHEPQHADSGRLPGPDAGRLQDPAGHGRRFRGGKSREPARSRRAVSAGSDVRRSPGPALAGRGELRPRGAGRSHRQDAPLNS